MNAALFYGQAQRGNLTPVLQPAAGAAQSVFSAKTLYLDFDWKPGFCVAVGYNAGSEARWDTKLDWTWYYGKGTENLQVLNAAGARLLPLPAAPILGTVATKVDAVWNLHYNVIDLSTARSCTPAKNLVLEPEFGVRAALIYENIGYSYMGFFRGDLGEDIPQPSRYAAHQKLWGLGPRLGADCIFFVNPSLGIFGNFFTSLLAAEFDLHSKFDGGFASDDSSTPVKFLVDNQSWIFVPNFESELGICYNVLFKNGRRFSLDLSYLMSFWLNESQVFNVNILSIKNDFLPIFLQLTGSLFLQGAKLNFCLAF